MDAPLNATVNNVDPMDAAIFVEPVRETSHVALKDSALLFAPPLVSANHAGMMDAEAHAGAVSVIKYARRASANPNVVPIASEKNAEMTGAEASAAHARGDNSAKVASAATIVHPIVRQRTAVMMDAEEAVVSALKVQRALPMASASKKATNKVEVKREGVE